MGSRIIKLGPGKQIENRDVTLVHILGNREFQGSNSGFHISSLTTNEDRHIGQQELGNQVMQTTSIQAWHLNDAGHKGR